MEYQLRWVNKRLVKEAVEMYDKTNDKTNKTYKTNKTDKTNNPNKTDKPNKTDETKKNDDTKKTNQTEQTKDQTQTKMDVIRPLPSALESILSWSNVPLCEDLEPYKTPIPGFMSTLHPHQEVPLTFILNRHRCILAMEMGLGKTSTLIAAILVHRATNPLFRTLVIVPSSLIRNWKSELERFAPSLDVHVIRKAKEANFEKGDVVLLSISLVAAVLDKLLVSKFDMYTMDEAHMAKNRDSQQSKALYKLCKIPKNTTGPRVVLLTGTPAQSHQHLYGLLRLLHPIFYNWFHYKEHGLAKDDLRFFFGDRYCLPTKEYFGRNRHVFSFKINRRQEELQAILKLFVLRLQKSQVGNLPPLLVEYITIGELSTKQQKHLQDKLQSIPELIEKSGRNAANALMSELTRETMRLKIPFILSYLPILLESDEPKIILFVHHHEMSKEITDFLTSKEIGFIHIDGEVNMAERTERQKQFEHDPNIRIGVLSFVCATGLNMTFVRLCVFCERIYEGVKLAQAEARIHRIGQTNPVTIQYLDVKGSTDSLLEANYKRKMTTEKNLLDDKEDNSRTVKRRTISKDN